VALVDRLSRLSQDSLFNRFDHVFNDLLRITEDHHGFIHVKEFVIEEGMPGVASRLIGDKK
jgi:hypothetical protein